MFVTPLRNCGQWKQMHCVLAISANNNVAPVTNGLSRHYAKGGPKGDGSCKDLEQTKGGAKKVSDWPRSDDHPPQPWMCSCPREQTPPCFDPYRIKVPDVVVPPLPPSNAKELPSEDSREMFRGPVEDWSKTRFRDLFHNSPVVHPDYWRDRNPPKKLTEVVADGLPKLGYHGRTKYKYAFHEPWKPLNRMALLDRAERQETGDLDDDAANNDEQIRTCVPDVVQKN